LKTKEVNTLLKSYLLEKFSNSNVLLDTDLDFSFKLPNKKWENDTKTQNWINIYLLEVKDNLELRSTLPIRDHLNNTERKPPYYIDLYYIITFYQNKSVDTGPVANMSAYDYMDTTLLALYDFYDSASYAALADPKEMKLEMFPRPYSEEQLNLQLWSALDQDVRPFISLKVTIPLESHIAKDYTPVNEDSKTIALYHKSSLYGRVLVKEKGTLDKTAKPYEGQNNTYAKVKITNQGGTTIYMKEIETDALGMFTFAQDKELHLDEKELYLKANATDYNETEIKLAKELTMPIEIILIKS